MTSGNILGIALGCAGVIVGLVGAIMSDRGFRNLQKPNPAGTAHRRRGICFFVRGRIVDLYRRPLARPLRSGVGLKRLDTRIMIRAPGGWILTWEQRQRRAKTDVPAWALGLMAPADAQRYAWEWGAHLHQLIKEGRIKQAQSDRRRLVLAAVTLAVAIRVRRALSRAR
jgi:hypothetical protein